MVVTVTNNTNNELEENCDHPNLRFGSGSYYVFCTSCMARWVRHNKIQPEYGFDASGSHIGSDPSLVKNNLEGTYAKYTP